MSDAFAPISISTNDNYFVLITAVPSLMTVMAFGNKSKSLIIKFDVTPENAMAFEEAVENVFDGKCQAIVLHIFNFKPIGYPHVMRFAYELRVKFADKRIYNFFYSGQSLFISGMLISAKIKSTKNDVLICIKVRDDRLLITEYLFTDAGYKQIREDVVTKAVDEPALDLRDKILKETKPKHIVVYAESMELPIMKKLKKNVFSEEKIHCLDKSILKDSIMQTMKISKYDRKIIKYHVIPKCAKDYAVCFQNNDVPFFTASAGDTLPIIKSECAVRDAFDMEVCGFDADTIEKRVIYTFYTSKEDCQNRHRSKLDFYIDYESFAVVRNTPIIVDIILELPTKLDDALEKKIPVISFCDNYSVICAVKEGDEQYSFLDGWNGIYGHDVAMYVDGLHRSFGIEAKNMIKENPSQGISNLTEMMSVDNLYRYDNPVFIDDENSELSGQFHRRENIVCFYMAKLLEEHFKVIRDETGNEIEEVAFWPVFTENTFFKERLHLCLKTFENIKIHLLHFDLPE
uniref:Uncharacterized protein n=1 Tax=Panagrolaimus sp. PS1159 TaxID=55785 RepID=A0AC35GKG3_9BILA